MGTKRINEIEKFRQWISRKYREYRRLETLQKVGVYVVISMFVGLVIYIVIVYHYNNKLQAEAMTICSMLFPEHDIYRATIDRGSIFDFNKVYDEYVIVTCDGIKEYTTYHMNYYIKKDELSFLVNIGESSGKK